MDETIIEYFERDYPRLLKLAIILLKDVDAGREVLHNVAVALLTRQNDLTDVENPGAYLAQCVRKAALSYLREKARMLPHDPLALAQTYDSPQSNAAYDYAEWAISLDSYLQKYAPNMRSAFILHYLDDVPLEAIAKSLGITINALSLRFRRMRRALAKSAPNDVASIDFDAVL